MLDLVLYILLRTGDDKKVSQQTIHVKRRFSSGISEHLQLIEFDQSIFATVASPGCLWKL